ncbi:protein phosphatase 2C-like protein 2 [Elsinoe australis]|uniref:Protein phosphatase 2C-like protein 2 n=1 Tax=Elsinoe australis TaxID=40998 RepID=A0A4V6DU43_9PEZI|nr:protein phosphatase 2C-like protein 2 [Elsinoe australis]
MYSRHLLRARHTAACVSPRFPQFRQLHQISPNANYGRTRSAVAIFTGTAALVGAVFAYSDAARTFGGLDLFQRAYADSLEDDPFENLGPVGDDGPIQQLSGPTVIGLDSDMIALSATITRGSGSVSHSCGIASNSPCEDHATAGEVADPETNKPTWAFFSIFDGHAGGLTATFLEKALHHVVFDRIDNVKNQGLAIADRVKKAFVDVDDVIFKAAKAELADPNPGAESQLTIQYAISGSCALMALIDQSTDTLYVANTGDSRAVLGRYSSGSYKAHALSTDHTGFNANEVARIEAEHPGETGIIDPASGRIFGLAVVRAFGDARWKWDDATNMDAHKRFWGPKPRPGGVVKTPPYVTAEPEVSETKIVRGKQGDFVIMASDGLWDHLSNEDAVLCVERWIEAKKAGTIRRLQKSEIMQDEDTYYDERPGYGMTWRIKPEYFSYEDENAAACLIRNAMGGKRKHLVDRVVHVAPPLSRDAHDDTTVHVIFFGDV